MSALRYVKVPSPVDVGNGLKFKFGDLVRYLVDTDDRFNKTMAGGRASMRLEALIRAEPGDTVSVHPGDWQLLSDAAEKPTAGYPELTGLTPEGRSVRVPIPARKLLPLVDALSAEQTKDPAESPRGDSEPE